MMYGSAAVRCAVTCLEPPLVVRFTTVSLWESLPPQPRPSPLPSPAPAAGTLGPDETAHQPPPPLA